MLRIFRATLFLILTSAVWLSATIAMSKSSVWEALEECNSGAPDRYASVVMAVGGVGDVSLAYNTFGWRQVETADRYRIEFESGAALAFGDAAKTASADIDLTAQGFSNQ